MTFEKWWEKNETVINRVLGNNTDYMKLFFENAFLFGKENGLRKFRTMESEYANQGWSDENEIAETEGLYQR